MRRVVLTAVLAALAVSAIQDASAGLSQLGVLLGGIVFE
jgi:hypothetical protein